MMTPELCRHGPFSYVGLYPDCPGMPDYMLTTPTFDKVTIRLDPKYYKEKELVITAVRPGNDARFDQRGEVERKETCRLSYQP